MCTYSLNYDNYNENLCDGLQSILASSEMSDVTLAVEGMYFKAHQVILSMFSTYFRELFQVTPSRHTIFFMKNVKHQIMQSLLAFIYEGKVEIPSEDFQLFVDTANELQIKGLSDTDFKTAKLPSVKVDTDDIEHITDNAPLMKRASEPIEQEAKRSKLTNNVPVEIISEPLLPLNSSHLNHQKIEEYGDSDFNETLTKGFLDSSMEIGPMDIKVFNHDSIDETGDDLDDEVQSDEEYTENQMSTVDLTNFNDGTLELGKEHNMKNDSNISNEHLLLPESHMSNFEIKGNMVTVFLCLMKLTQELRGIIWDNYRYCSREVYECYSTWKCTLNHRQKCKAKLLLNKDGYICLVKPHNHPKVNMRVRSNTYLVTRNLSAISYENFHKAYMSFKNDDKV